MIGTSGAAQVLAGLKRGAGLVAFGIAVVMTPCAGQFEVTGYAGGYAPTAYVMSGAGFICTAGEVSGSNCGSPVKQETAPVMGGRVTDWLSTRVAVEGSFGYAPSGVPVQGRSAYIMTGGVSLLVSVKPRASGASVYFTGGVGAVAHGGDWYVAMLGTTGWGPVVGVGARLRAGPSLAIRAGLEDYLYNFSPHDPPGVFGGPTGTQFQNDLVLSLGLSVSSRRRSGMGLK
jgi:hypothetical protein